MFTCDMCNETATRTIGTRVGSDYQKLCMSCYQSYKRSDGIYPLPPAGTIQYSPKGWPICHICGMAHRKVLQHAYYRHNIKAYDYKVRFNLTKHRGIMSADAVQIARSRVYEHKELCIDQNLIQNGQSTRFKLKEEA